ncbi:hypothetical protein B0H13DRAFT_2291782 [Mycena leptocephala]|nr:hypothetical protein B0H13DRAFT_2291782 [Mycena leptocephala]
MPRHRARLKPHSHIFPATLPASAMRCTPNGAAGASRNHESWRACNACMGRLGGGNGVVGVEWRGGSREKRKKWKGKREEERQRAGGAAEAYDDVPLPSVAPVSKKKTKSHEVDSCQKRTQNEKENRKSSTKFGSSKYRHTGGCAAPAATRHINRSLNFECSLLLCTIFATIILVTGLS